MRSTVHPLGELLFAFHDLAREPNDHVMIVGLAVDCDLAKGCVIDPHGSTLSPELSQYPHADPI
jgi:hypothetical protein